MRSICLIRHLPTPCILVFDACVFGTTPPNPATGTPDQFFGLDKVYTFHLTLTPGQYRKLERPGGPGMARPDISGDDRYPTATASLQFEGQTWGAVNPPL